MIDDSDKRILRIIQQNPAITMRELGDLAGMTHTPCWRRINALRDEGVISDRRYILDARKLGFCVTAICTIQLVKHTRDSLEEFEQASLDIEEIVQVYSATGDQDYILRVIARDVHHYEETIKYRLLALPHIGTIKTSLVLKEIKNTLDVPIY